MRGIQIKLALNCFDFSLFDAIKNSIVQTKHIYIMAAISILCVYISAAFNTIVDTVGLPVHNYTDLLFPKIQSKLTKTSKLRRDIQTCCMFVQIEIIVMLILVAWSFIYINKFSRHTFHFKTRMASTVRDHSKSMALL